MNVLDYCRAMASYCRQRTRFDGEDSAFWSAEAAQWESLLREHGRSEIDANLRQVSPVVMRHDAMSDADETLHYRYSKTEADSPVQHSASCQRQSG
jgi:hypothetical protein